MTERPLTVMQLLPELEVGGVERGTVEIAEALVTAGHRAIVVSGGGRLVDELEALGATHLERPIGEKRLRVLREIAPLATLICDHDVDIVHARSRLPAWIGRLALRRIPSPRRPRWVTTVHGPYTVNAYSGVMVSGERVIAISSFIRDYITRNYPRVDPARIRVIPRGVDARRYGGNFAPSPQWSAAWQEAHPDLQGQYLLAFPARLTRWKGQEDFIAVIAALRRVGCPVHGLLIGTAHRRKSAFESELRALAERLGVNRHLTFLGQRADLRELLAVSDLALSLPREPEAFGRTTIEALALGTPVVGYAHGGTAEILDAVYPAGLVPVGDIEAVAERCRAVLEQPPAVPVEHPFTTAALQAATLEIYAELMREKSSRS